jgi:hypothetical protein
MAFSALRLLLGLLPLAAALPGPGARAADVPVAIAVDAGQDRHPISPLIYGVNFGTTAQLIALGAPLNRSGGDDASLYNWRLNARNAGKDWYYESLACTDDIMDQHGSSFVALTKAAGAQAMITVPMMGWVAKLDSGRKPLASFSIGIYGLQQDSDIKGFTDAGNGVEMDGTPVTGNDPNDAAMPHGPADEKPWIERLVRKWGDSTTGGVRYYIMDNEPSVWQLTHRDVHPIGAHAQEIADKVTAYSAMVKAVDPHAQIVAPEEWGWTGYRYSGFDQQYAVTNGFDNAPDRTNETKGLDYLPWLLTQWKAAGHPVDVVSVHFYPQNGEYSDSGDDVSVKMQLMRNRSTRDLWDTHYTDPSWIHDTIALIPRLRRWVDTYYYPGTPIAITEYNWGAEKSMNGATTEADILGIFGREGLDIATRWIAPATGTPTEKAMQMYRNYDGRRSGFGDASIRASVPDPDTLAAFAALRGKDGAMTVMVINKQLDAPASAALSVADFADHGTVETYQLADNAIRHLPDGSYRNGRLSAELPAQSVTLFVLHGATKS